MSWRSSGDLKVALLDIHLMERVESPVECSVTLFVDEVRDETHWSSSFHVNGKGVVQSELKDRLSIIKS